MSNIIPVTFGGGHSTYAAVTQWDYGQILTFPDLELPETYQVHFSNAPACGTAVTVLGGPEGVSIPDTLLQQAKPISAYVFLHAGEDDGETVYTVTLFVKPRQRPTEEQPTPVQRSALDEAIAALQDGVQRVDDALDTVDETVNAALEDAKESGEFDGADGVSPAVQITAIEGGHRIIITDAEHPTGQSFDVMDGQGGGSVVVDNALSTTSENPVQNKVVKAAVDAKYTKPSTGIPYNDMSAEVRNRLDSAGIFYATYNVTTGAEIEAAYQAGKKIICVCEGYYLPLTYRSTDLSNPYYVFGSFVDLYGSHEVWCAILRYASWSIDNIYLDNYATFTDVASAIDERFFKPFVLLMADNVSLVLNMAMGNQAPDMFINHGSWTLSHLLHVYVTGMHMEFYLPRAMLDGGAQTAFASFRIEALQVDTDTGTITSLTLSTTIEGKLYWAVLTPVSETTMTGTLHSIDGANSGKLDKDQGVANAGKFLVVGSDGYITTRAMTNAETEAM